jgi:hypothetical protein
MAKEKSMNWRRWVILAGLLFATACVSGAQEAKKTEAPPIQQLSWLEGGVWVADASKLAPGMQRIETRYEWSDNKAYLHFTTHFVFEKGTMRNYDGNLFWDPQKSSLAIWYMDAHGGITQGPMIWDGKMLTVAFHGPDFEGKPADLKVEVTRLSNEHYHWMVAEKDGDAWKEVGALDYLRQGSAEPGKPSGAAGPDKVNRPAR